MYRRERSPPRLARVEVMINHGPWQEARVIGDRRRHCWQWWELLTHLRRPGHAFVRARATGQAGHTQPGIFEWNCHGDGNNAVQEVIVTVAE